MARLSENRQRSCRNPDGRPVQAPEFPARTTGTHREHGSSRIMSLLQLSWADKTRGLAKYLVVRARERPYSITLELTRRCNARCDYCDHWREPRRPELEAAGFI